jgi:hypothetical protein
MSDQFCLQVGRLSIHAPYIIQHKRFMKISLLNFVMFTKTNLSISAIYNKQTIQIEYVYEQQSLMLNNPYSKITYEISKYFVN